MDNSSKNKADQSLDQSSDQLPEQLSDDLSVEGVIVSDETHPVRARRRPRVLRHRQAWSVARSEAARNHRSSVDGVPSSTT